MGFRAVWILGPSFDFWKGFEAHEPSGWAVQLSPAKPGRHTGGGAWGGGGLCARGSRVTQNRSRFLADLLTGAQGQGFERREEEGLRGRTVTRVVGRSNKYTGTIGNGTVWTLRAK